MAALPAATDLYSTFNLQGAPTGSYDVQVSQPGFAPAVLNGAFTVNPGLGGSLAARIIAGWRITSRLFLHRVAYLRQQRRRGHPGAPSTRYELHRRPNDAFAERSLFHQQYNVSRRGPKRPALASWPLARSLACPFISTPRPMPPRMVTSLLPSVIWLQRRLPCLGTLFFRRHREGVPRRHLGRCEQQRHR